MVVAATLVGCQPEEPVEEKSDRDEWLERVSAAAERAESRPSCSLEDWTYRSLPGGYTQVDGSTSCSSGMIQVRFYDGDKYLGSAPGIIHGGAFQATIQAPAPDPLRIRYEIEPD